MLSKLNKMRQTTNNVNNHQKKHSLQSGDCACVLIFSYKSFIRSPLTGNILTI